MRYTYFNRYGVELRRKRKHVKRGLLAAKQAPADRKHTVFVEDPEDVSSFSTAEYFNTPQQLVTRRYNRVTTDELAKAPVFETARLASKVHRPTGADAAAASASTKSTAALSEFQRTKALEQVQEWDFDSDDTKEIDRALGLPVSNDSDDEHDDSDDDEQQQQQLAAEDIAALLESSAETRARLPPHVRKQIERAERARKRQYAELATREVRVKSLTKILAEMQLKTQLMVRFALRWWWCWWFADDSLVYLLRTTGQGHRQQDQEGQQGRVQVEARAQEVSILSICTRSRESNRGMPPRQIRLIVIENTAREHVRVVVETERIYFVIEIVYNLQREESERGQEGSVVRASSKAERGYGYQSPNGIVGLSIYLYRTQHNTTQEHIK